MRLHGLLSTAEDCHMEPITNDAHLLIQPATLFLLDEEGPGFELQAEFTYDSDDPYAVSLTTSGDNGRIVWTFARDLLSEGLVVPTGDGDVRVFPGVLEEGPPKILIELSVNGDEALMAADRSDIEAFVAMSHELVARGSESEHLDIDAVIALILQKAACGDSDD